MNWDATLTNLGDYLADNYPTNEDARRISTQAGLKPRLISFSQKAVNTWFSVLNHAKNRNKIQDVIEVVKKEIGDNDCILACINSYFQKQDEYTRAKDTSTSHSIPPTVPQGYYRRSRSSAISPGFNGLR